MHVQGVVLCAGNMFMCMYKEWYCVLATCAVFFYLLLVNVVIFQVRKQKGFKLLAAATLQTLFFTVCFEVLQQQLLILCTSLYMVTKQIF